MAILVVFPTPTTLDLMDIKNLLCSSQRDNTLLPIDEDNDDYSIYPGIEPMSRHQHQHQHHQPHWSSTLSLPESDEGSSPTTSLVKYSPPSLNSALLASPPASPVPAIIPPLPTIPPVAVATVSRRQHKGSQSRIPWTQQEDELLQLGYNQGLSWAMISSTYLPHRSRGCCWGRFKTLQTKSEIEHHDWSEAEDELLDGALKKHADLFRHAWKVVAHELRTSRSWRECESRSIKICSGHMIRKRH